MRNKGITLIALIITIIVLLILAGVALSSLSGENGLLNRSNQAKEEAVKAQLKEEIEMAIMDIQAEELPKGNNVTLKSLAGQGEEKGQLENHRDLKEGNITAELPEPKNEIIGVYKGYEYTIDENLKVTFTKNSAVTDKNTDSDNDDYINPNFSQQVGTAKSFDYTGSYQEYEVQDTGYYKIECWGASGGSNNWIGSLISNYATGGYSSGTIKLTKGEKIYIYVGQQGANGLTTANKLTNSSFNGGGSGIGSADGDDGGGAGGGATDIRLVSGNWDNFESLKSRIMVAGGGSGGATIQNNFTGKSGGSGGGISATGSIWKYPSIEISNHSYNATQTTGYKFGIGQNAITYVGTPAAGGAGAGGGYYGGYSSTDNPSGGAGGGSGFISGYDGCNAIAENSTEDHIIHTNKSIHYSGKYFLNCILLDGNSITPNKITSIGEYGNSGNGFAKITFLGDFIEDTNSIQEFDYTGSYQEYEVQDTGYYKIECWGASGGSNNWIGSLISNYATGGYSAGTIKLTKGEKIYIYVGQQGANGLKTANELTNSSFNGGGSGIGSADGDDGGGAGGGATDIRLVSGDWNNFESLKSRIMVAGGGSGGASVQSNFTGKSGGSGGGISATGSIWKYLNVEIPNHLYNATQTTGYKFGIGENAITDGIAGGAGAGGGYYGGYSSTDNPAGGAGGGSGFISGYDGCNAIAENSTENHIIHTNKSIHYSGKYFLNTTLLDGNNNIPDKYHSYLYINGNSGNGYVKITKMIN